VKLTDKQKETLRPFFRDLVENVIEMQMLRLAVERILKHQHSLAGLFGPIELLASEYRSGEQVTLDDVQQCIDACEEEQSETN
jgi:hypothetical protein